MNYLRKYICLVRAAEKRNLPSPHEKHHVFPTAIFGKNNRVVKLTIREHFVAHKLLYKIFLKRKGPNHCNTKKMLHALRCMMIFRDAPLVVSSKLYAIIREHNRERRRGDNNPSKRTDVRKKISEAKTGKQRLDLKNKKFFGSIKDTAEITAKSQQSKKNTMERNLLVNGKKVNYPSNRVSPPCSDDKKENIRLARLNTHQKYIDMSEVEFSVWVDSQILYGPSGRRNGNVTRAVQARGLDVDEFFEQRNR